MKINIKSQFRRFLENKVGLYFYRSLPHGIDLFRDLRCLIPHFKPKLIVDVGANVGLWSQQAIKLFPTASIICIEPVPAAYANLCERFKNENGTTCFQIALGEKDGTVQMTFNGASAMNRIVSPESWGARSQHVEVKLRTLDDFLKGEGVNRVNLLKIDAEGYDLKVLQGASETLSGDKIDVIYIEAGTLDPPDVQVPLFEIQNELSRHGFSLFGIYEQVHEMKTKSPRLRRINAAFISNHLAKGR